MRVREERIHRRALDELARQPDVVRTVREVANAIKKDAKRLAPRSTGTLARRGIEVERTRRGFLVGWNAAGWYGWLVESGTEDAGPRPHLVPAAIANGARPAGGGAL